MAAENHAGMSCVTASVDELIIHADPIVGELVIIQSQVNCAFKSSMEVGCKVTAEDLKTGNKK
jgi:acyl-CoA hydrolase